MTVLASSICTSLPCYPPVTLLLLHVSNKSRTTIPTIPTVTFTLSRTPMPYCTVRAGSCRTELGRYIFNPEDVPKLLYPVLGVLAVPLGTYCTIVRTIYQWCWYRVLYLVFLITFCTYGLCISRIWYQCAECQYCLVLIAVVYHFVNTLKTKVSYTCFRYCMK